MKNTNLIIIVLAILVAGFLISGSVYYVNQNKSQRPSASSNPLSLLSADVGEKVINYLNENILKDQGRTASLSGEITEESGLYKLIIKIGDQEFPSYASLDGKLLFPDFIDITKTITQEETQQKEIPKTDKPEVELFVMSFCPYGNLAEDIMKPVRELLGDKINLKLRYIVSKDNSGKYNSLHGDQELNQDVRELCVFKYQKDKAWDFVDKINQGCTSQNADTCWEKIASDLGIDVQKIKDCQANEASTLLDEEIKLVEKYGVTGSPQLFINGVEYQGNRTPEAYKNGICSGFNTQPQECQTKLSEESSSASGGCQ